MKPKTQIGTRKLLAALLASLVAAAVGCQTVPCLSPLYAEHNLAWEPELIGLWVAPDDSQALRFEAVPENSYRLTYRIRNTEAILFQLQFQAHLLRLGNELFLDLVPEDMAAEPLLRHEASPELIPVHFFCRLRRNGDELQVALPNREWLQRKLRNGEVQLAHHDLGGSGFQVTASTEELQNFVQEHLSDEDAFSKPLGFRRPSGQARPRYRVKVDVPWQLEEAAAEGYVMVANGGSVLLLEDSGQVGPAYEYRSVIAQRAGELERALDAAGAAGFRVAPQTLGEITVSGILSQRTKSQVHLARAAGETRQFEFRVFEGKNLPALQMQMNRANAEGFEVVLVGWRKGALVILERPRPAAGEQSSALASQVRRKTYLLLDTFRTSTLQKELNQAAAAGYRLAAATGEPGKHVALLERPLEQDSPAREYLVLAAQRAGTLEKELNQAADRGFRAVPGSIYATEVESVAVLEKLLTDSPRYHYRVLSTTRLRTLEEELLEAAPEGYAPVGLVGPLAVLEKPADPRP
jgi:hypothetical protein